VSPKVTARNQQFLVWIDANGTRLVAESNFRAAVYIDGGPDKERDGG